MFFVGISAHILIYLLVPALLIVYFYSKGIGGSPEIQDSLPATVIYVSVHPSSRQEKNYVFIQALQQQISPKKSESFHPVCLHSEETPTEQPFYGALYLSALSLRAPPRF